MTALGEPVALGARTAPTRIVFGPHVTNLGRRRAISDRHVEYYRRRAVGGAGVIVVEEASVHPSDWPYERCPLASDCVDGWAAVAAACHESGTLALAGLGHAGSQGSSAYHQSVLLAPGRVPDVVSREVPKAMEEAEIAAVVDAFASAAGLAVASGLDGVELNAGQHSLLRQFLSGLTNQRDDPWGADRSRFLRAVLDEVRTAIDRTGGGPLPVLGLRLCCDELAPWAGITPETGAELAAALAPLVDYLVVVRGSIYSIGATRPDCHEPAGLNNELCRAVREAVAGRCPVVAQGSIVEPAMAETLLAEGAADLVEMTRAQIADPDLGRKVGVGAPGRVRPCVRCNQTCQVRDARNPLVTCIGEPSSGHEWEDEPTPAATGVDVLPAEGSTGAPVADAAPRARRGRHRRPDLLVVGGGPAGLECARVAASSGLWVELVEREARVGGMVRTAALAAGREPLVALVDWLEAECRLLGVRLATSTTAVPDDIAAPGRTVVCCTGSVTGRRTYPVSTGATNPDAAEALAAPDRLPDGPLAIWDPIGGPIGISVAETLRAAGREVTLIVPDLHPGTQLSLTGDLAPAATRLQAAGVALARRTLVRGVERDRALLEDRYTGVRRSLSVAAVIDAGHRLPNDRLWQAAGASAPRAGDCVAPRTIAQAVLEGRRAALALRRPVPEAGREQRGAPTDGTAKPRLTALVPPETEALP